MSYKVELAASARKAIRRFPDETYRHIAEKLGTLQEEPRPEGVVKLEGKPLWRVRVGRYRIVYHIDDQKRLIKVTAIGHRREVYR